MNDPREIPDYPNAPATNNALKFVRGQKALEPEPPPPRPHGGGGGHSGGDEHEETVHVDERWLIAYADKMTLLAGLFIMLFAMSTLDKTKFEKVKQSTEKSFGKPVDKKQSEMVDLAELTKHIEQLEKSKKELEMAKASESILKSKLQEIQRQIEERSKDQVEMQEQAKKMIALKNSMEEQTKKMLVMKTTMETQQKEIQELVKANETLEKKLPTTNPESKIQELQKVIKQQQKQVEKLEEELVEAKTAASGSFLAFVMSWSTKSHDIDLKVEDPEGKTFDFKHREFSNHPGLFVLDTRQGPGAEIWQSDKVLVGTYKFTFHFYNQHGNPEPCVITAKLFTPKGGVDLPQLKMDGVNQRSFTAKIQVDKNGKGTLLP